MSCFGILHLHESNVGERLGSGVIYLNGHNIVLMVGYGEGILKVGTNVEITQYESRSVPSNHLGEKLYGLLDVGLFALRMIVEHLTNDI